MQHRIILVETGRGLPVAEAHLHWHERHADVYLPTPLLAGYVQNRPLEEEWERLGNRSICSETWFADHDAVMLAHFSTSRAADSVRSEVGVPVLAAPEAAVTRMKTLVGVQC